MKNISLVINGILILAVIGLYYLHFAAPSMPVSAKAGSLKKDSITGPPVKPSELKASDIVYVNLDTLNAHFEMIVENSKIINGKQSSLESDYRRLNEKFQNDYEGAQKEAQSGMLSAAAQEEVKNKLTIEQNELAQKQDQLRAIEVEASKKQAEVMKKLNEYLIRYNASGHYRFILPYSGTTISPVLFGRSDLDITPDVLKGLNDEYRASKSRK